LKDTDNKNIFYLTAKTNKKTTTKYAGHPKIGRTMWAWAVQKFGFVEDGSQIL